MRSASLPRKQEPGAIAGLGVGTLAAAGLLGDDIPEVGIEVNPLPSRC